MKVQFLSLLAGIAMIAGTANAAEPVVLSAAQMDQVTGGTASARAMAGGAVNAGVSIQIGRRFGRDNDA
jgi:hypothetical protein